MAKLALFSSYKFAELEILAVRSSQSSHCKSKVRRLRRDAIKVCKRDLPTGFSGFCKRPECGLAYD